VSVCLSFCLSINIFIILFVYYAVLADSKESSGFFLSITRFILLFKNSVSIVTTSRLSESRDCKIRS
jgi:hypothetical protein